jgi:prevent-host-death family protein
MKHVPVAAFKDRVAEYIAEAQAGEEVIVTRHGKPTVKLVAVEEGRRAKHREAINGLFALGREIYTRQGPTSPDEIRKWIEEDRP